MEFKIAFGEITPETTVEINLSLDLAQVQGDTVLVEAVEMQGRLLWMRVTASPIRLT